MTKEEARKEAQRSADIHGHPVLLYLTKGSQIWLHDSGFAKDDPADFASEWETVLPSSQQLDVLVSAAVEVLSKGTKRHGQLQMRDYAADILGRALKYIGRLPATLDPECFPDCMMGDPEEDEAEAEGVEAAEMGCGPDANRFETSSRLHAAWERGYFTTLAGLEPSQ